LFAKSGRFGFDFVATAAGDNDVGAGGSKGCAHWPAKTTSTAGYNDGFVLQRKI
jgi:hypothetical protein